MIVNPANLNIHLKQSGEVFGGERKTLNNTEGGETFGDFVKNAINSVNDTQQEANQKVTDFVSGKTDNVHDVMIAVEKAQLSFQLMTEIRNRVVDTYKELSRMPM